MTSFEYPEPVAKLLTIGSLDGEWPNYVAQYNLTAEHIPALIRMAVDPSCMTTDEDEIDDFEYYAHIHAWRALGQLHAVEAAAPLIPLFNYADEYGDDWAAEDLPEAIVLIGTPAIPALGAFLLDPKPKEWAKCAACESLELIVQADPAAIPEITEILTAALANYMQNNPIVNAAIISLLGRLRQPSTYALVEEAFAAEVVDTITMEDWEDFQVEVGLLENRITPRAPRLSFFNMGRSPATDELPDEKSQQIAILNKNAAKKDKNKQKQAKQSRKQNNKKKKKK
jgi:hypothetical protein